MDDAFGTDDGNDCYPARVVRPNDQTVPRSLNSSTTRRHAQGLLASGPTQIYQRQLATNPSYFEERHTRPNLAPNSTRQITPVALEYYGNQYDVTMVQASDMAIGDPSVYACSHGHEAYQGFFTPDDGEGDQGNGDRREIPSVGYVYEPDVTHRVEVDFDGYGIATTSGLSEPSNATLISSRSSNEGGQNNRESLSRSPSRSTGPVACPHCGTTISGKHASGNLTRHMKNKSCTSSKPKTEYPCETCSSVYQRSDALLNHTRRAHGAPGPARRDT